MDALTNVYNRLVSPVVHTFFANPEEWAEYNRVLAQALTATSYHIHLILDEPNLSDKSECINDTIQYMNTQALRTAQRLLGSVPAILLEACTPPLP